VSYFNVYASSYFLEIILIESFKTICDYDLDYTFWY